MRLKSIAIDSQDLVIKEAVEVLGKAGLIVYPTDTLYGIGADATKPSCVEKVFKIKQRDPKDPISAMVSDFKMLGEYVHITGDQWSVLHELLPGRVSVILESSGRLAPNLSPDNSIAFRIPLNPFCISMVEAFGKPITSTSANVSGEEVPASIDKIIDRFGEGINLYIDGGELAFSPSTLVDLRGTPKILREGEGLERVKAVIGEKQA